MPDGKRKRRYSANHARRRWYAEHRSRRFGRRFGWSGASDPVCTENAAIAASRRPAFHSCVM